MSQQEVAEAYVEELRQCLPDLIEEQWQENVVAKYHIYRHNSRSPFRVVIAHDNECNACIVLIADCNEYARRFLGVNLNVDWIENPDYSAIANGIIDQIAIPKQEYSEI